MSLDDRSRFGVACDGLAPVSLGLWWSGRKRLDYAIEGPALWLLIGHTEQAVADVLLMARPLDRVVASLHMLEVSGAEDEDWIVRLAADQWLDTELDQADLALDMLVRFTASHLPRAFRYFLGHQSSPRWDALVGAVLESGRGDGQRPEFHQLFEPASCAAPRSQALLRLLEVKFFGGSYDFDELAALIAATPDRDRRLDLRLALLALVVSGDVAASSPERESLASSLRQLLMTSGGDLIARSELAVLDGALAGRHPLFEPVDDDDGPSRLIDLVERDRPGVVDRLRSIERMARQQERLGLDEALAADEVYRATARNSRVEGLALLQQAISGLLPQAELGEWSAEPSVPEADGGDADVSWADGPVQFAPWLADEELLLAELNRWHNGQPRSAERRDFMNATVWEDLLTATEPTPYESAGHGWALDFERRASLRSQAMDPTSASRATRAALGLGVNRLGLTGPTAQTAGRATALARLAEQVKDDDPERAARLIGQAVYRDPALEAVAASPTLASCARRIADDFWQVVIDTSPLAIDGAEKA